MVAMHSSKLAGINSLLSFKLVPYGQGFQMVKKVQRMQNYHKKTTRCSFSGQFDWQLISYLPEQTLFLYQKSITLFLGFVNRNPFNLSYDSFRRISETA